MYTVNAQVIDENGVEIFSFSMSVDKSDLLKDGYVTPGIQDVMDVLSSADPVIL